ncbi:TPA: hypothetical protein U1B62_000929 [Streptococcus suis]|nr:hypothetical protein [Streptococcus suis]HEM3554430.1 hypothetical protein [Streptococcus suis]HEM3557070.1 hypothetical protein [Streptococcus suis]
MKPKKYPYSGRQRLVRKEMPRFVKLGSVALCKKTIDSIEGIRSENSYITVLILKIPKPFLSYEEKIIKVRLPFDEVVSILNQY